jgi:hypothetical protein
MTNREEARSCQGFLLLLTPHSLVSPRVKKELDTALSRKNGLLRLVVLFEEAAFKEELTQRLADLPFSFQRILKEALSSEVGLEGNALEKGKTALWNRLRFAISGNPETYEGQWGREVKDAVIPFGVKSIGKRTFAYQSRLQSVAIASSVETIEEGAFFSCASLTSVHLPSSVLKVGKEAFASDDALQDVTFSEGFEVVSAEAFRDAPRLLNVHLPESLLSLGDKAFAGCISLTSLQIGKNVAKIGRFFVHLCYSLDHIVVAKDNPLYFSDRRGLYSQKDHALLAYAANSGDTYRVLEGTRKIPDDVFPDCPSLRKLSLPSRLKEIAAGAFLKCQGLEEVDLPSGVRAIGQWAFRGRQGLKSIVLPQGIHSIAQCTFETCSP